jgi:hypothetical protein
VAVAAEADRVTAQIISPLSSRRKSGMRYRRKKRARYCLSAGSLARTLAEREMSHLFHPFMERTEERQTVELLILQYPTQATVFIEMETRGGALDSPPLRPVSGGRI